MLAGGPQHCHIAKGKAFTTGCAGQGVQTGLDHWVLRLKVIWRGWEGCRQQARHQLQRLGVLGLAAPGKARQGEGEQRETFPHWDV